MVRVPYTHTDEAGFTTHGTFEADTAECFTGTDPDPEGYTLTEQLYCDDRGSWYLDQGHTPCRYVTLSDDQARQWLLDNHYPEESKRRFDRPKGGRPSKGAKIEARIPARTLRRIDDIAERHGLDQPEMIRRLLTMAVKIESSIADSGVNVPRQ